MMRLMRLAVWSGLAALTTTAWATAIYGQGVLVNVNVHEHVQLPRAHYIVRPVPVPHPLPPGSYKIKEIAVQTRLVDQVAKTQVSQSFVNTGSVQMEVCFVFPLPYDGAVDQLTLLVDGKEFPAKLLPADEARRAYEDIVRKNRDPALLEWIGSGMFKTSVFPVPPGAERKVTLRYAQLCRKDQGLTDYLFPLSTAKYTSQPVEKVDFQVSIESSQPIKNVYSPSHPIEIKRPDDQHATVSYTATNQVPIADFRLLYDVAQGPLAAKVISFRPHDNEDGYFLLLASPEIKPADAELPKKTVVFVVDRSGSMSGEKFEQAKGALRFVLNNLREGDLFNVVAYDSQVESFRPELQRFNDETRKAALGFVSGLYPGGSTNINGALQTALAQLKDASRPNFVIFLTDGLPTDGETNEGKIVAAAKAANGVHARVFSFGVGYDVNSRLLDRLVRANFGQSEYVRPNENIESRVSSLYNRIAAPVMTDLAIQFDVEGWKTENGPLITRAYPADAHDLFAGEQLVLVGRYKKAGTAKIRVSGKVQNQERSFDFPGTLVEKSPDDTNAFIEKLWAIRRAGEIIDELDLKGKNDELIKELVSLSTKHGVLTPYTSFMADDQIDRHNLAQNFSFAEQQTRALSATTGENAFDQRSIKGGLQRTDQAAPAAAPEGPITWTDREPRESAATGGYGGADGNQSAVRKSMRGFGGTARRPLAGQATGTPLGSAKDGLGEAEKLSEANSRVQTIGRKTFYRQGDSWVDASLTAEQQKKARQIARYGDEYFKLLEKHGQGVAKYLAMDDPVVVELDGEVYSF